MTMEEILSEVKKFFNIFNKIDIFYVEIFFKLN